MWEEYGLTKLRYNSLKMAINQELKEFFKETPVSTYTPVPPHNYDVCLRQQNFSSIVYKKELDDVLSVHNKYLKWVQELGSNFCESLVDFGKIHLEVYKCTPNLGVFSTDYYKEPS